MNKVRQTRKAKGVSLYRMSKELNLNYGFLWNVEKGNSRPGIDTAMTIATYLGCDVRELFTK